MGTTPPPSTSEKRPRPQYHYFYGSTTDTTATIHEQHDAGEGRETPPPPPTTPLHQTPSSSSSFSTTPLSPGGTAGTDYDSLVGECLVSTDNEEEMMATPNSSDLDLQHLLISNGIGGGTMILDIGGGAGAGGIRSSSSSSRNRLPPRHGSNKQQLAHQQKQQRIQQQREEQEERQRRTRRPWYHTLSLEQLRDDHPLAHFVFLLLAVTLVGFLFTVLIFPNSRTASSSISSTSSSQTSSDQLSFHMPFTRVDRTSYDPVPDNIININLFDPDLLYTGGQDGGAGDPARIFNFPFPTGAFWTNLVLRPTADRDLSFPIVVYPYAYKWSSHLLQVSYPRYHRREEATMIHDDFFPDLTLDSNETIVDRQIMTFDALSVTLRYRVDSNGNNNQHNNNKNAYWQTFLVQGSPYVTMEYFKVSPVIRPMSTFDSILCPMGVDINVVSLGYNESKRQRTRNRRQLSYGVCYQEDSGSGGAGDHITTLHGVHFIIQSREGLSWFVFASEPISLTMDMTTRRQIYSPLPFSGVLRLALVPPNIGPQESEISPTTSTLTNSSTMQIEKSTGLQRLIYHAGVYPVSGDVSWSFSSSSTTTDSSSSSGSGHLAVQFIPGVSGDASAQTKSPTIATTAAARASSSSSLSSSSSTTTTGASSSTTSSSSSSGTSSSKSSSSQPLSSAAFGGGNSNRVGTIVFKFTTRSFSPTTTTTAPIPLLMLALPHHAELLPSNVQLGPRAFDTTYSCIKGQLTPILGSTWSYDEPLLAVGFEGDKGSSSSNGNSNGAASSSSGNGQQQRRMSDKSNRNSSSIIKGLQPWRDHPAVVRIILDSLEADMKLALPTRTDNIYGFGKQVARVAQLAHIADSLLPSTATLDDNSTVATTSIDPALIAGLLKVSQAIQGQLRSSLYDLLSSNVSDSLVYDANLGGIVTMNGLLDSNADFGNGRYNDHHFHYGYILYACSIMGRLDPTFIEELGGAVDAIFFDVANNANLNSHDATTGAFFPVARHKAWFDGHSFASGLFPFGNGKSQESSSEAVNCYYGAYLWSAVRHGSASQPSSDFSIQTDFARLLLAMEVRGAKTYWHMLPQNEQSNQTTRPAVYSQDFAKNYMVGNLGMLDAICSTWFRTESLYVHMINFMPVTSITGELFNRAYVSVEYNKVFGPHTEVEMAWRGYVVADHAIQDPVAAWEEAQSLFSPQLDSAVSKSQILYWIATRNGFDVSKLHLPTPEPAAGPLPNSSSGSLPLSSSSSSCENNNGCASTGLTGECCPTLDGIVLGCCSR